MRSAFERRDSRSARCASVLFGVFAFGCAHASDVAAPLTTSVSSEAVGASASRTDPTRIVHFTLEAAAVSLFEFRRPPRVAISDMAGAPLGACVVTSESAQAVCSLDVPYSPQYVLVLDDATNVDRAREVRIVAPPSLHDVRVVSTHSHSGVVDRGEDLLWWSRVQIGLETDEVMENVSVSSLGAEGLFLQNGSLDSLYTDGVLRFFVAERDAWVPVDGSSVRLCMPGTMLHARARVGAGEGGLIGQLETCRSCGHYARLAEGSYRAELEVRITRSGGRTVEASEAHEHAPSPQIFEFRKVIFYMDSLERWAR